MILKIISAEDIIFQGEVDAVTLPGVMGQFTVLQNHAALISSLSAGKITYQTHDGRTASTETEGGLVDVDHNVVSVCVY
jgi:F-type H+-transporting ATPase subunit epsilon